NAQFTPSKDRLIIETSQSAILLDGQTGNTIMNTEKLQPYDPSSWVRAVLMQHMPLLVTANHRTDSNKCSIALWDITSNKSIATLLEKQSDLLGIGVTADCRSIVVIK